MDAPKRLPENTHPGNDGATEPTITLAKSCLRYYHSSASTFLDLVDDPEPTDWRGTQRLRLRAGSRRPRPPLRFGPDDPREGLLRPPSEDLTIALEELYRESSITYWPPAPNPSQPDPELEAVYRLLNPPSHLGNVAGTADERSIIYLTGGQDMPQAIIFISFDPGIKLAGIKKWLGRSPGRNTKGPKGVGEGPHIDGRATGITDSQREGFGSIDCVDMNEQNRTVSIDWKGKGVARPSSSVHSAQMSGGRAVVDFNGCSSAGSQQRSWVWVERAMYQDIGLGYWLGC